LNGSIRNWFRTAQHPEIAGSPKTVRRAVLFRSSARRWLETV
jgi:hypothetical protein